MVEKILKDFKNKYLDLVILFFFPLLQVSINSNWIFNPIKALPTVPFQDTWFYNGNFFYFFDYANEGTTSTHYFVERLPSNIPGYYLYHLFSPLTANYILHLGYYYIAVFSIYSILHSLLNKRSALITSLAMGSYPWFLRAVGWDYVDGVGIAYYCLSMALMVAASKQRRWGSFMFCAGIAIACLVFTNLFWIPFALILVIFYIVLNHLNEKRNLLLSGLFMGGGGLTITTFFSVFFYFATGRFLFFEHSIKSALKISESSNLPTILEWMYGPMEPYWLILPILFLTSACFLLASKKMNPNNEVYVIQIIFLIQFCLFFGLLILWHVFFQPYLIVFLYMSYLIPSTFLLFGALISDSLADLTDRQFYFALACSIAVFIAPLALTLSSHYFIEFAKIQDNLILLVFSGSVLTGFLLIHNRFSVVFACAAIAIVSFIGGVDANVYVKNRWEGRNSFVAVVDAVNAINKIYPDNYQKLVFMYDNYNFNIPAVAIGGIYTDLSGNGYRENNPIDWLTITSFNNRDILLIAQKGNAYKKIEKQFSEYPDTIQFSLKEHVLIQSGNIDFYMFFFHFNFREYDHLYPGETFEFDRPFDGENFYALEKNKGMTSAWSGPETESEIHFKVGTLEKDARLSICVNNTLQPEILDSFQLYANNVYIPTKRSSDAGCYSLFEGTIPKTIVNENPLGSTVFTFRVDKTISPQELGINNDDRSLGLSFDWIRIK
jgi:hypothetical protein